jgi:hypothetical protein
MNCPPLSIERASCCPEGVEAVKERVSLGKKGERLGKEAEARLTRMREEEEGIESIKRCELMGDVPGSEE